MKNVYLIVETKNNNIKKSSLELLSVCQDNFENIDVCLLAESASMSDEVKAILASYKVSKIDILESNNFNFQALASSLSETIKKVDYNLVLASSNSWSQDVLSRVSAKLDISLASDCTHLKVENSNIVLNRPMYAGKCEADINCSEKLIVLMRPNQMPIIKGAHSTSPTTETLKAEQENEVFKLIETIKGENTRPDLSEAEIVVSGGRGLKEAQNYKLIEELADTMGASLGASRAIVDAGWVPHDYQVGQTGKTVAPNLYIAAGISGAIQHLAGMSSSKVIVAINTDSNAPIFEKATYGIVGDLFEVLPKLKEQINKLNS